MTAEFLDMVSGGIAGSLIGAVGGVINKWQDIRQARDTANSEIAKLSTKQQHELEMARLNKEVSVNSNDKDTMIASMQNESTPLSAGKDSKLLEIADFIRGLTRPVLTAILVFFSMGSMLYFIYKFNLTLTADQAYILLLQFVQMLVSCTGMALGWWFGSRKTGV